MTDSFVSFTLISFACSVTLCLLTPKAQFSAFLFLFSQVSLKRPSAGHPHAPPPMRPMSASQGKIYTVAAIILEASLFVCFLAFCLLNCFLIQVVSKSVIVNAFQVLRARQVEEQIKATLLEQESFEASITSR